MSRYLIIIEPGERNYSAYVPDLPGCIATGRTRRELLLNMRQAIDMHLEGLLEDGLPVPEATTDGDWIEVDAGTGPAPQQKLPPRRSRALA